MGGGEETEGWCGCYIFREWCFTALVEPDTMCNLCKSYVIRLCKGYVKCAYGSYRGLI